MKKIFIIILLWWMAVPYALGESTEQDRCVVDSLREAIRLKDSLYSKASVETLAKYNAEFGNDQLQEENHFVSRSRTYIIILNIMLLAVAVVLVLRQRRLIALQKARHLLDTTPDMPILDVAKGCGYDDQSSFTRAFKRFFGVTPSDYLARIFLVLLLFTATMGVEAEPVVSAGKPPTTSSTVVSRKEAMRLYEASGSYYEEQLYDSAVIVGEQALPMLRQLGMTDEVTDELSILAVCTSRQSDYQKALRYAKECNAMDRASGDKEMISSSLNTIGAIYVDAKQPQEGLKYILEALQLAEEINHRARIAMYCGAAAETEFTMNHFDAAQRYIERAIQLEREDGRQMKWRVRLSQKAAILLGMKQYQEALAIFDTIIPYFRREGNRQSLAISLNKVGHTLLSMSREDGCGETEKHRLERQAVPYLREAVNLCHEMGNPYNEMHARDGLYQALWTISPDSARLELERFDLLRDSLYNNDAADLLARYMLWHEDGRV